MQLTLSFSTYTDLKTKDKILMPSSIASFTTVNSGKQMTVSLRSVSHIIEHKDIVNRNGDYTKSTCWICFDSGKSVHVLEEYKNVQDDLTEFHKTQH